MNFSLERFPAPALPLPALLILAGAYLLTGLIGHDPWKGEDAIHLGIAYAFWQNGHWLAPQLAGEFWPHTAPLYHWVAAGLGQLLSPWLTFHDGARLASALFASVFLIAISGAARTLYGDSAGRIAPLLAIGTLGFMVPFHETQPAVAGLAGAALAWWGGACLLQEASAARRHGAELLGLGVGLAFLSHGLVGILMALAVLPAPTFRRDGSAWATWATWLVALVIALLLIAAWPLALFQSQPELLAQWWRNEWAEATIGRRWPQLRHLELIAWASWPVLPMSAWGFWVLRRSATPVAGTLALPLTGVLIGGLWFFSGPARALGLFPLLIPLILLAAAGADSLRRGASNAFDWFGVINFSFVAMVIWLGASALHLGWPAAIARNFNKLAPGYDSDLTLSAIVLACAATLGWLAAWRLPRAPWRSSLRWAAGAAMMWVLVTSVWMGWINHYKNYRPLVLSLEAALPPALADNGECIVRRDVNAGQRALLDYFAGIRTVAPGPARNCRWQLVIDDLKHTPPPGWTEVWRGARPSDRKERWYLERRAD